MALLHRLPQACSLLLERCGPRDAIVMRSVEVLRTTVTYRGWSRRPSAGRQAGMRRNHRQITRHHACAANLFMARCHGANSARSKTARSDRRKTPSDMRVVEIGDVRVAHSVTQRREAT